MTDYDIDKAEYGSMRTVVDDVTVAQQSTDGIQDQKEKEYVHSDWSKWYGYYRKIPEVKIAHDMRAVWTVGNGYECESSRDEAILDRVQGNGNETFEDILWNLMVTRRVCGDSFAEIITVDDTLVNLKVLDPSSIKVIRNNKGMIVRYEQIKRGRVTKFRPEEILHFVNKRVADEGLGISDIEAIEEIIKALNENFMDYKTVMHRYVKPMMKFILDTDDESKIDAFIAKADYAVNKGENLFIPKGMVEHELISVPANSTLSPISWREHLKNYFFQVVGIPQIILGSSGEFTESTAKIAYLAFEQSVKAEQRYIQAQIWKQLHIRIKLEFPVSMRNELLTDESKDGMNVASIQPNELNAETGR